MLSIIVTNVKTKAIPAGGITVQPKQTITLCEYTEEKDTFIAALKLAGLRISIKEVELESEESKEIIQEITIKSSDDVKVEADIEVHEPEITVNIDNIKVENVESQKKAGRPRKNFQIETSDSD